VIFRQKIYSKFQYVAVWLTYEKLIISESTEIADPSMPKCQERLKTNGLRFFTVDCWAIGFVS